MDPAPEPFVLLVLAELPGDAHEAVYVLGDAEER